MTIERHRQTDISFPGQPWSAGTRKVKPFWIINAARGDEVAVALAGSYANHLHLAPD